MPTATSAACLKRPTAGPCSSTVGELPCAQVKLRALQERKVRPLGDTKDRQVDPCCRRVVAHLDDVGGDFVRICSIASTCCKSPCPASRAPGRHPHAGRAFRRAKQRPPRATCEAPTSNPKIFLGYQWPETCASLIERVMVLVKRGHRLEDLPKRLQKARPSRSGVVGRRVINQEVGALRRNTGGPRTHWRQPRPRQAARDRHRALLDKIKEFGIP